MKSQHSRVERSRRRALTLLALAPLTCMMAVGLAHIVDDNLLRIYGFLVLAWTTTVLYLAFARYEDPAESPPTFGAGPAPFVSFLVAVKDDVEIIEDCVRSLLASTWPHLEVIVVDDASTDGTAAVLRRLAAETTITFLRLERNVGKKRALTEGVRRARGDILVFTDSDCVVDPDAVQQCVQAFLADPDLGALSGHARALNADQGLLTRIQDVWYDGQFGVTKAAESTFGAVTCVSGPLAAFRREAIVNYLPAWAADRFVGKEFRFATDRQLTGYVLCQEWVGRRLKDQHAADPLVADQDYPERRWRVGYVRSARVATVVPDRLSTLMRQQVRWKKSFLRSLFFTGRYYGRRGPLPAALYYTHVVLEAFAPAMVFTHLVLLPARGLGSLTLVYFAGVVLKGSVWGLAYRAQNPGDARWVYRPLMSLLSALVLSWLLPYALLTIRRSIWSRGAKTVRVDELEPVLWVAPNGLEYPMEPLRWTAPVAPVAPAWAEALTA